MGLAHVCRERLSAPASAHLHPISGFEVRRLTEFLLVNTTGRRPVGMWESHRSRFPTAVRKGKTAVWFSTRRHFHRFYSAGVWFAASEPAFQNMPVTPQPV